MFVFVCGARYNSILTAPYSVRLLGGTHGSSQDSIQTGEWLFTRFTVVWSLNYHEPSQLALTTHPDKNPDNEAATQQFQQISEAYHVLATHLDKSAHRHEYADPFDTYDDDDYDDNDDDEDDLFYDFEELQFYLWVAHHISPSRIAFSSPRRFMYEQMLGGGRRHFHMRNRNTLPVAHPHKLTYKP